MLIADGFSPPVAACRARSPHPFCDADGAGGPAERRQLHHCVDVEHWNADDLNPPDGRSAAW
jgi:hypothetical protein